MPSDTTVAVAGSHSVPLKTTGHENNHLTIILITKADGTKMKPYVFFKGKGTQIIEDLQNIPGMVVHFWANGWMNDALTIDYLHRCLILQQTSADVGCVLLPHKSSSSFRNSQTTTAYNHYSWRVWNACFKSPETAV